MREELLHYYERELTYLRRMGAEFAQRYPKVASRLQLEPHKCEDPHVERMLEAFAFLAARVHLKLDDDFPEVSESLLSIVYPQHIRPIPSMSLVELRLDPDQGKLTTGYRVKRDTMLYSRPIDGVPCKFRTCYDTTLWPVTVASAQWLTPDRLKPAVRVGDAVAVVRLELRCFPDVSFSKLGLDTLRLHLAGEGTLVAALYELLFNNCKQILVRELPDRPGATPKTPLVTLPPSALRQVGFGQDEGILPYPGRSFQGYRLLQEYFAFPEKYHFIDLSGFDQLRAAGMGRSIEVLFPISPFQRADWRAMLEPGINASTFRLGATPIVNLFPQTSEPILLTQRRHEYQLVADARRRQTTDVYSVDDVVAVSSETGDLARFAPFYAHRHATDQTTDGMFWLSKRQLSGWRTDGGTDVFLSFVNLGGQIAHPSYDAVTARLTCFNGDLPSRLPFGNETGDFEVDGGGPFASIVALVKPTPVVHAPLGGPQMWRLISLLSLNYLSLVEGGTDAMREILRLHDFADSPSARKQIAGVLGVKSAPTFARIATEHGLSFARGRRVDLELDEEQFTGAGVFLFASVLEHFLGLYASVNSLSVLSVRTAQRKGVIREWPPRAGWKALL